MIYDNLVRNLDNDEMFQVFNHELMRLCKQKDFSPSNDVVNKSLTKLINLSLACNCGNCGECEELVENFSKNGIAPSLREISYKSEVEMEKFWGNRFANTYNISYDNLKEFWYFEQYLNITKAEKSLIDLCESKVKNVAFAGSGALPLTAVILDEIASHKYSIDLIDYDTQAIETAKKYCEKVSDKLSFIQSAAIEVDYSKYDLVFIASMIVGKKELIEKLYAQGVKYIIVRDAEKLSQLFYEPLNEADFGKYEVKKYIAGNSMSVNSSYLLEKR